MVKKLTCQFSFSIDPDFFASDSAIRNIDDIILHYTFFRVHYWGGSSVSESVAKGESILKEETGKMFANAALLSPEVIDTRDPSIKIK